MKRGIRLAVIMISLVGCIAIISRSTSTLATNNYEQPGIIRATVYDDFGVTASGQYVRYGVIAGRPEWRGRVAMLWDIDEEGNIGEFIGYFEVLDTGSGIDTDGDRYGDSIKNGTSIDVWTDHPQDWIKAHGDHVYMQLVKGEG